MKRIASTVALASMALMAAAGLAWGQYALGCAPTVTLLPPTSPPPIPYAGNNYSFYPPSYSYYPGYSTYYAPPARIYARPSYYEPRYLNPGPYYYTPAYAYTPGYYSFYYTPGYFRY
jgi:hypothetical protein